MLALLFMRRWMVGIDTMLPIWVAARLVHTSLGHSYDVLMLVCVQLACCARNWRHFLLSLCFTFTQKGKISARLLVFGLSTIACSGLSHWAIFHASVLFISCVDRQQSRPLCSGWFVPAFLGSSLRFVYRCAFALKRTMVSWFSALLCLSAFIWWMNYFSSHSLSLSLVLFSAPMATSPWIATGLLCLSSI